MKNPTIACACGCGRTFLRFAGKRERVYVSGHNGRAWTPKDEARLRELYPDTKTEKLAALFGRPIRKVYSKANRMGLEKSAAFRASPEACHLRRENNPGVGFRYKPGNVPANKGLRRPGWGPGRMKETQFKKGHARSGIAVDLYKPIGTERLGKDGYLERKVNDDLPLQKRWRAVHVILWEKRRGKIPRHHVVRFKNGDKTDIRLGNLQLIHRREVMRRNTVHNLPKSLKRAVMQLGALNRQIKRRTA